ncbi:hypothetical protein GCM10027452_11900 [Micromonospora halotolerans]
MPVDLDGTMPAAVTADRQILGSNQQRLIDLRQVVVRKVRRLSVGRRGEVAHPKRVSHRTFFVMKGGQVSVEPT